jgi:hypothetical protein
MSTRCKYPSFLTGSEGGGWEGKVDQRRIIIIMIINWQTDNRVCRSGEGRQADKTTKPARWEEEGEKRGRDKTRRDEPGQVRSGNDIMVCQTITGIPVWCWAKLKY